MADSLDDELKLPSSRDARALEELGPVILRCRRTPIPAPWREPIKFFFEWIFVPAFLAIYVAALPLYIAAQCGADFMKDAVLARQPIVIATYIACVAILVGLKYWLAVRSDWILHEKGFRYGKRICRYDEIDNVTIGRRLNAFQQGVQSFNDALGRFSLRNRIASATLKAESENSITVEQVDGKYWVMGNVGEKYLLDDIFAFATAVGESRQSRIDESAPLAPDLELGEAVSADVDDLSPPGHGPVAADETDGDDSPLARLLRAKRESQGR